MGCSSLAQARKAAVTPGFDPQLHQAHCDTEFEMASSKRRKNKKLHQRRRKKARARSSGKAQQVVRPAAMPEDATPSELDQMGAFIGEAELGRTETSLADLRSMVGRLPFEAVVLHLALLLARVGPRLNDPAAQWELAKQFYASRDELLTAYQAVLREQPKRAIFSPQALMLLMRLTMEHARHEPMRDLTQDEVRLVQDSVLGAHSAMEVALDAMGLPSRDHFLAYELQAATFFRRPQYLEEMARHQEFLRLATEDERLMDSANRVPVAEWLARYGVTADEQWALGFGLAAMTHTFGDQVRPRALAVHVDDLLTKLGQPDTPRDLPVIAASRSEFNAAFRALGDGDETLPWEVRPFKSTPFLRLTNGDLLLLSPAWLLSWLGRGVPLPRPAAGTARRQRFQREVHPLCRRSGGALRARSREGGGLFA
jgi:hypothetical protein